MYVKASPVTLKASASSLCNNMAILCSTEKQTITYAIVHKAFVCLANVAKGGIATQKQVSCKGEGAHSSSSVLQVSSEAVTFRVCHLGFKNLTFVRSSAMKDSAPKIMSTVDVSQVAMQEVSVLGVYRPIVL